MLQLVIMSILGTVAFAVSGAMVAVQKNMDLFGVNILAIVTAVGGGAIRDIMIGNTPPVMFKDPMYVAIAAVTANIVFLFLRFHKKHAEGVLHSLYESILFLSDALGLAAFTINGVIIGMGMEEPTPYVSVFLGVLTGVGGGVLRDVLAQETPAIFVKHIYAVASLAGALLCVALWNIVPGACMLYGFLTVLLIRVLASIFHWNLPRINDIN